MRTEILSLTSNFPSPKDGDFLMLCFREVCVVLTPLPPHLFPCHSCVDFVELPSYSGAGWAENTAALCIAYLGPHPGGLPQTCAHRMLPLVPRWPAVGNHAGSSSRNRNSSCLSPSPLQGGVQTRLIENDFSVVNLLNWNHLPWNTPSLQGYWALAILVEQVKCDLVQRGTYSLAYRALEERAE